MALVFLSNVVKTTVIKPMVFMVVVLKNMDISNSLLALNSVN